MCNYEMDLDLLTNGTQLKACDFERNDTDTVRNERKGRKPKHPADREERRMALAKAKQRKNYALRAKMK